MADVSITGKRGAVDQVIGGDQRRISALTERLRTGKLQLHEWETQMQAEIKALHVAVGTVAHGGQPNMGPREYGALGRALRDEYAYLRRFAIDIAAGVQPLNGILGTRASLYVEAARATFWRETTRVQRAQGARRARWVLSAADHCTGCVAVAALGFQPLDSLPPIGSQDCRSRCRCDLEYQQA